MKKNLNFRKLLILVPLLLAIILAILMRNPQEVNPGGNTGSSVEASTTASSEIAATLATSDESPQAVQGTTDSATESTSAEIAGSSATEATSEAATQVSSASEVTTEASTEVTVETAAEATTQPPTSQEETLPEDGEYTSKDDVALYIHTYGKLPGNFITKKEAQKLGWSGGSLEPYAPGKSIGGDNFGNYEELLPKKKGRKYYECDIDTKGKNKRGAKRIIFSNDGLVYYTKDHYESFELLYGDP